MVVEVRGVADHSLLGSGGVDETRDDDRLDGEEVAEGPRRVRGLVHNLNQNICETKSFNKSYIVDMDSADDLRL